MAPKISIIVPVYNAETYIHKCIQSVLAQTFTNFELILINDGSSDTSGAICDEYLKIDNRILVVHKKNEGVASARNTGLKVAKGKYIGFVDSDDFINKKMYELLYNAAEKYTSELIVCDFIRLEEHQFLETQTINTKYEIKHRTNLQALNQLYKLENGNDELMGRAGLKMILACNKLYKRTLFENNLYRNGKIYEDEFIIHRILYACSKITYIPVPLYYYLQREGSIVHTNFSIKKLDRIDALKDRVDFFKEKKRKYCIIRH